MIFKSRTKLTIGEILKFAAWTRKIIKQGIELGKPGKKLTTLTTNDLDENLKLKPDSLNERKKRDKDLKEKEKRNSTFSYSKHDWR